MTNAQKHQLAAIVQANGLQVKDFEPTKGETPLFCVTHKETNLRFATLVGNTPDQYKLKADQLGAPQASLLFSASLPEVSFESVLETFDSWIKSNLFKTVTETATMLCQ